MKVWISKNALTSGVYEAEVEKTHSSTMFKLKDSLYGGIFFHEGDWHLTKQEALSKAESIRTKRIASLREQLHKLEQLNFKVLP